MKIFQILDGFCHWQTPYKSLQETVGKFPPDLLFVEAPDYVFESWGYLNGEFIKPLPPAGWIYDDETGTFYPEAEKENILRLRYENKTVEYISQQYTLNDEAKVVREKLAGIEGADLTFDTYNAYVIDCKARAYAEIYGDV